MSINIQQMPLISAISHEISRQHPGATVSTRQFNAIIQAANNVCDAMARATVMATPDMGLDAWLDCDDTGASSMYMALTLSKSQGEKWFSRKLPENRHPHDSDDLGRCIRLIEAVPEFAGRIDEMAGEGPQWAVVASNWDAWRALYSAGRFEALNNEMGQAFAKVSEGGF